MLGRRRLLWVHSWGIPGLSRHVELKLLDLLTSQLDHELISHNVTVGDLQRMVDRVLEKSTSCSRRMLS